MTLIQVFGIILLDAGSGWRNLWPAVERRLKTSSSLSLALAIAMGVV